MSCVKEHNMMNEVIQNEDHVQPPIAPLVKWSGGKKDEIKRFAHHLPEMETVDTYLEPFIGGGALYFHLRPQKAAISDVHKELIDLYQSVKDGHGADIRTFMSNTPNEEGVYYSVRDKMEIPDAVENAKRFYYLRKTCYRGMLRYNKKGKFNIPFGRYKTYKYDAVADPAYQELLGRTDIFCKDFTHLFETYNSADNFMFLDPPYDSEFTDYGYCSFGREEHERLAHCFKTTTIRCMMVIGATEFIRELYDGYIVDEYDKKYRFKLHSNRIGKEIDNVHLVIKNYK